MSRTKAKQSVDEYIKFDKYKSLKEISKVIPTLTEIAKGGVLFLTEKVDKKAVLDLSREFDISNEQ